ncbi:hypothetical protein FVEN_g6684 [Fusarium venenatum]|uniref:Ubiquitin 3 binding protein But2 C-terminal domain-containing protein n=1 Tax=Fusarium venenatum TaxID=56646 RepID=D2JM03_9HYPO|nr:hypothetical protein FVENE_0002 [Fusarium venenatum]KAG8355221.1 hypothetical protein FVEN_g6684 [Fusarium venenatum]KAH7006678.1 hypothetical protein EDB82DRAFT_544440 [Fusarium venenatum]
MRVLLFATGLSAAIVVVQAGVCKPAYTTTSHSDAVSTIESSATSASATLTETLGLSTTETVSLESTETSAPGTTLATTTTEVLPTSVTEEPTTTTTEGVSATISSSTAPSATPGSIVGTGPVAGLALQGDSTRFIPLSFEQSGSTQTLIFTLLPNGQLFTGSNNNYLCLNYKDVGVLSPLVICPFDNFSSAPLTCLPSSDDTLACSAPNGSCDSSGTCRRPNSGTRFSQFYVNDAQKGFFGPASGDFAGYTAINPVLAR